MSQVFDERVDSIIDNLRSSYGFSYREIFKLLEPKPDSLMVPISIFQDRRLGLLESLVVHLKEKEGLKFAEIAKLLNRDHRTIWTTHAKARKKLG